MFGVERYIIDLILGVCLLFRKNKSGKISFSLVGLSCLFLGISGLADKVDNPILKSVLYILSILLSLLGLIIFISIIVKKIKSSKGKQQNEVLYWNGENSF